MYSTAMIRWTVFVSAAFLVSCATTIGAGDPSSLPDDAVNLCENQCEALGLELDALSIGNREVSCVCEPED